MTDAKLENRRNDASAKCANCKEWGSRDLHFTVGMCALHEIATLDLSVCSAWEAHEIHTGRILNPDEIIEE